MHSRYTGTPVFLNMNKFWTHIFLIAVTMASAVLLLVSAARSAGPQQPAPQTRSIWDGVYTDKQAQRGQSLYGHSCASCHGDKLLGKTSENSPALTGDAFEKEWDGRNLGDLFRNIIRKMPDDDPGTLTPQQTSDLVAYILNFNKYPSGQAELPPDNQPLAGIRYESKKPDQKK